jgi:hypothetical protein
MAFNVVTTKATVTCKAEQQSATTTTSHVVHNLSTQKHAVWQRWSCPDTHKVVIDETQPLSRAALILKIRSLPS